MNNNLATIAFSLRLTKKSSVGPQKKERFLPNKKKYFIEKNMYMSIMA
jgi:hypothetical protein